MHYKLYSEKRGVPTPVAFIAIVMLVVSLAYFFHKPEPVRKASRTAEIEQVKIANVSDNSITVFWRTSEPQEGYIVYGTSDSEPSEKAFDELDKQNAPSSRRNHVVTINRLKSSTQYFFRLVNDNEYTNSVGDKAFSARTARRRKSTTQLEPAYGLVIDNSQQPVTDAVVTIKIAGSGPLVTRTKSDGSFLASLCCLYEKDTLEPIVSIGDEKTLLSIIDEAGSTLSFETTISDLTPLSQTLTLKAGEDKELVPQTVSDNSLYLKVADKSEEVEAIDIIFPRQDASIPGSQPLIKGTALVGSKVKGIIEPEDSRFEVDTNDKGLWSYVPGFELTPGEHTLTIQTADESGNTVGRKSRFIVQKSGEAILGEATLSGTLTPTETVSSPSATLIPTQMTSPTLTISETPTPPVTGGNILPLISMSIAFIILGAGLILVF